MNIFYLDTDPIKAAQSLCDKHIVKMANESQQLLASAHFVLDGVRLKDLDSRISEHSHVNHPCAVWVRQSVVNYQWLYEHYLGINAEYYHRYGKRRIFDDSACDDILFLHPKNTPSFYAMTAIPQCMPDEYKHDDTVTAYRRYYKYGKTHLHKWKKRNKPAWLNEV